MCRRGSEAMAVRVIKRRTAERAAVAVGTLEPAAVLSLWSRVSGTGLGSRRFI